MPEVFNLSYVDYAIVACMLVISAGIGLYFRFRDGNQKTSADYLLAGLNMPIFPVAFSLMATFMSATTLMGIPAEMYMFGTHMAFMNVGFVLGPLISSYVFLPVYYENEVSSPYEYLEKRFGSSTRKVQSGVFLFCRILYNGVVLYAPALALSAVTDLSIWTSVISIGVICTFLSTVLASQHVALDWLMGKFKLADGNLPTYAQQEKIYLVIGCHLRFAVAAQGNEMTYPLSPYATEMCFATMRVDLKTFTGNATRWETMGGMKVVLWTDMFQAFLMLTCLGLIIVMGCVDLGGFSTIFKDAYDGERIVVPTFHFDFSARYSMYSVLLMGIIITVESYGCCQCFVQQQLSLKTLRSSLIASLISAPLVVAFHLLCCLCGLIFYAYFKSCDPMTSQQHPIHSADQLLPYYITLSMSQYPGLPGLCIAGIFSASLSPISSAINSMAAVTYQAIIKPFYHDPSKSVLIIKAASVFYGALSIIVTYIIASFGNLVQSSLMILSITAGTTLGMFLLAVMTTTTTEMGANLGILAGFLIGSCMTFIPNARHYPTLPVGTDCYASCLDALNSTSSDIILAGTSDNGTECAPTPVPEDDNFPVSYMWIAPTGLVTTIVVGFFSSLIASWFTERKTNVPVSLLCPLRRKFSAKDVYDVKNCASTGSGCISQEPCYSRKTSSCLKS